jgi:hypothetical protein
MLSDRFKQLEQELLDKIMTGEAPFLSLYAEDLKECIRDDLSREFRSNTHSFEAFLLGLLDWPALTASHLTAELNAGMVRNEVYPHIEQAFRLIPIQPAQKKLIWKAFRWACELMGLQISPRLSGSRFMVDEYVLQMGVPLRDACRLAKRMRNLADDTGYPDPDDPDSMGLWQEKLVERLNPPFPSTARRAVELDYHAYYARLFLDVVESPETLTWHTTFQRKMAEALREEIPPRHGRSPMAIPRPVLRDGILGVLLPPRSGLEWVVEVDGNPSLRIEAHDEIFMPLVEGLPRCVCLQAGQERSWDYDLWPGAENDCMLLFGRRDSRLLRPLAFVEESVFLEPGEYQLLSRFDPQFEDYGTEHVSEDPSQYLTRFELNPGKRMEITRGAATATLEAEALPLLRFTGKRRSPLSGPAIFLGSSDQNELKLEVLLPPPSLPEENVDNAAGAPFWNMPATDTGDRIVRLRSSLGDPLEFLVRAEAGGILSVPLAERFQSWRPGLALVTAECFKPGTKRILARCAALIWNGLERVVQGEARGVEFRCVDLPESLDRQASENLIVDEGERRVAIREKANRTCTTVFRDGSRRHSLTWAMPGIHIELATIRTGQECRRPVSVGETLTLNRNACEYLHVYGLESGILRLANARWPVGDEQVCRPLPLAVLRDEVTPDQRDLIFERREDGNTKVLVRFVTPHHAEAFKIVSSDTGVAVGMKLTDFPEAFSLRAENLYSGEASSVDIHASSDGETPWSFSHGGQVGLSRPSDNAFRFQIEAPGWPDGLWIVEFGARVGGNWGNVVNTRGDKFACILPVRAGQYYPLHDADAIVQDLDSRTQPELLRRVHRLLQGCFAKEAWNSFPWLDKLWKLLLRGVAVGADEPGGEQLLLLGLFGVRAPDDSSPSWLPLVHLALERPDVLAWPGESYQGVGGGEGHFLRCLRALSDLTNPVDAFASGDYSSATLMGFSNPQTVEREGVMPQAFSLQRLLNVWSYVDLDERRRKLRDQTWIPGRGDFLDPLHYRFAVKKLGDVLGRTVQDATMSQRRRVLASQLSRRSLMCHSLPLGQIDASQFTWERFCGYEEGIINFIDVDGKGAVCFLAVYAYLCRQAAYDPRQDAARSVESFLSRLLPSQSPEDRRSGAQYLVTAGEDLLGFFLLFWELHFQTRRLAG